MSREFSVIAILTNKLFVFLLLFCLAKILGVKDYGIFSYHYAIITGVATVIGECFSLALSRYAVLKPVEADYRLFLILTAWGGVAGGLISFLIVGVYPLQVVGGDLHYGFLWISGFVLTCACIFNLSITGLMFSVKASFWWVATLAVHGLLGLLVVVCGALLSGRTEVIIFLLGVSTLFAPVCGALLIKRSKEFGGSCVSFFDFKAMKGLVKASEMPSVVGSMLLGAPVHIACLMIFVNASLSLAEVGYFNLFFLFYILITVLPSSLASFAIVRLVGKGLHASRLYLLLGVLFSCFMPAVMYFSQDYWLCFLGDDFCNKKELLLYSVVAGGFGLITTIIAQVLHSKNMTKVVFLGSSIYAIAYLSSTVAFSLKGGMSAGDLFKAFLIGLVLQIVTILTVSGRRVIY